jgi:hypothetical protein
VLGLIALGLGVKKAMHGTISVGLKADLEKKYKYAHIKFKTDMEITFEIGAPKDAHPHSLEALAINDVDIKRTSNRPCDMSSVISRPARVGILASVTIAPSGSGANDEKVMR